MKTYKFLIASTVLAATAIAPGVVGAQQGSANPQSTDRSSVPGSMGNHMDAAGTQARASLNTQDKTFLDEAHASGQSEIQAARLAAQRSAGTEVRQLAARLERDHVALNAKLAAAGAQPAAGSEHGNGAGRSGSSQGMPGMASSNSSRDPSTNRAAQAARGGSANMQGASYGDQAGQSGSGAAANNAARMDSGNSAGATAVLAADPHMSGLVDVQGTDFDRAYVDMVVKMHQASIDKFTAASNDQAHSAAVRTLAQQALPNLREHVQMASALDD